MVINISNSNNWNSSTSEYIFPAAVAKIPTNSIALTDDGLYAIIATKNKSVAVIGI